MGQIEKRPLHSCFPGNRAAPSIAVLPATTGPAGNISKIRILRLFLYVQKSILDLYTKAQTETLKAQEIAWLEQQTQESPYFSLAYMVLARHHLDNKSTVKDRVLVRSATYSQNRGLLRQYLHNVLPNPVASPQPTEEATEAPPDPEAASEAAAETPASPEEASVAPETEVAPAADVEVTTEDLTSKAPTTPEVEPEISETSESVAQGKPVPEAPAEAAKAEAPDASPGFQPSQVPINWFVNMRLKLRTDKYVGNLASLRAEAAQRARTISPVPPAAPMNGASEPVAEPEKITETPEAPTPDPSAEASKPSPEVPPLPQETPVSEVTPPSREPKPKVLEPAVIAVTEERSDYQIGAFSSFTFVEPAEDAESDENEIDSMMPRAEAVEIATDDSGTGPGQITFEEKDRIVEVTVTPEELNRYFKGRLPVELNFSPRETLAEESTAPTPENPEFSGPLAETPNASEQRRQRTSELIERFIEEEPSISRIGSIEVPSGDLSQPQETQEDEWVTETLAVIYAKQGNKTRARQIYETLALRFPEKSDYFAFLIQKL